MNTTTYVGGTAAIVIAGRWAQDKPIDVRIALGAGVMAIGLALINNQAPQLAGRLSLVALLTAAFMYVPAIASKTGITKPRGK